MLSSDHLCCVTVARRFSPSVLRGMCAGGEKATLKDVVQLVGSCCCLKIVIFFPLFFSPKCSRLHPYNLPSVTKENNSTGSILPVSFGIVKTAPVLLGGGGG